MEAIPPTQVHSLRRWKGFLKNRKKNQKVSRASTLIRVNFIINFASFETIFRSLIHIENVNRLEVF